MSIKDKLKEFSDKYNELYNIFYCGVQDQADVEAHEIMLNASEDDLYILYQMTQASIMQLEWAKYCAQEYYAEKYDVFDAEDGEGAFECFIDIHKYILKFIEEELERRGRDK